MKKSRKLLFSCEMDSLTSVNGKMTINYKTGKLILDHRYRGFKDSATEIYKRAAAKQPKIKDGAVGIFVTIFYKKKHRKLDLPIPMGDWDNPIKPMQDALEAAGVIDDDTRIVWAFASKHYRKAGKGISVELWSEPDLDCAEIRGVIQSHLHARDP